MTYAIFKAAGQQFRAEKGATVRVPKLPGEPGTKVTFDEVLLTSAAKKVTAGKPTIEGASVEGQIVRHGRDRKLFVFRFKRRKGYRKKTGHRQDFTEIKITNVHA